MKQIFFTWLCLPVIVLCLPDSAFSQTKIALNWKAEPQFGGFYQAQLNAKLNTQLDNQLNAKLHNQAQFEILEGGSGTPTIQMLTFGKVDYAIVSAEEILISNEKNPKNQVVALFAVFQTNPQAWITRKDRGLKSIGDILNSPGILAAQSGLTYAQFLKKKYPNSKVKWVPYTGGISGLVTEKNYTQQGFFTSEPFLAEKQGIEVSTFLIADEGFNPYTTVVAVRKTDLEKNRASIQKVISALKKGWQDYLKDPKTTNESMAKINKSMDLATFQKSADAQKPLIETSDLGSMKVERWDSLIKTLVNLKVLKKPLNAKDQFNF